MNFYAQIASNKRKSMFLILGLVVFISVIGFVFSKAYGYSSVIFVGFTLVATILYSIVGFYFADKMVLALSGATRVDKSVNLELYRLVENLCLGDGLPLPEIYIIDDSAPNAFATGRDPQHAAVCFTTGLLAKLNRQELEGVVAHELSHIKNYDTRLTTLAVILVGVIALLSDFFIRMTWFGGDSRDRNDRGNGSSIFFVVGLALAILAPIIASIMRMALSRQREYLADASGAFLTRYPEGLAQALEKIGQDTEPLEAANNATASMYFANPLKGNAAGLLSSLFDTHPPIEERIRRLRAM
jgi:heat shock protein HtpX